MKNKTKHTPGPWTLYTHKNEVRVFGEPMSRNVATVTGNNEDARLIAAAPELLEAAKLLLVHFKSLSLQGDIAREQLKKAIAKAERGEVDADEVEGRE